MGTSGNLGASLREARDKKNLTQQQVADELFVTRQTISRWEQNKTLPNIYVLRQLSELYGLSIDTLIQERGEEKMNRKTNYLNLLGLILFNLFIFSGIGFVLIMLLLCLWLIVILFISIPLVLLVFNMLSLQEFSIMRTILSIIICFCGIKLFAIAKKLNCNLLNFFKKYYLTNIKYIFK